MHAWDYVGINWLTTLLYFVVTVCQMASSHCNMQLVCLTALHSMKEVCFSGGGGFGRHASRLCCTILACINSTFAIHSHSLPRAEVWKLHQPGCSLNGLQYRQVTSILVGRLTQYGK